VADEDSEHTEMTDSMHNVMNLGGDAEKLRAFYDRWATEYDADVGQNYGMPSMVVSALRQAIDVEASLAELNQPDTRILDAGCGTGQVGIALAAAGYTIIDGIDLSPEMIRIAETTGVYRNLEGGVDLTLPAPDSLARLADIVTIGGVFTVGHVPPEALATVATLVRHGGLLSVSTREAYHQETDYVMVQDGLVADGALDLLLHIAKGPYTMDSTGDYWVYLVN
jgi:predicted TPR repeat methyltransferase